MSLVDHGLSFNGVSCGRLLGFGAYPRTVRNTKEAVASTWKVDAYNAVNNAFKVRTTISYITALNI